jgi:predicted acetyltransferase
MSPKHTARAQPPSPDGAADARIERAQNDSTVLPIDAESADRLSDQGLRLELVDTSDAAAFSAWLQAENRGFHLPRAAARAIDEQLQTGYRRTTGVWDATAADAAGPVATIACWPTPLTVPGERTVPSWAISAVTVAPTHRRRGIARQLIEAELRTAKALGIPVAILTVSEATIYSRYGFAPTATVTDLTIDTRRVTWTGPTASGRLHLVPMEQLKTDGRELLERVRLRAPGEIQLDEYLWQRLLGLVADDDDEAKHLRAVRYDDAEGRPQGFAIYRIKDGANFSSHVLEVKYLVAVTDDAHSGIWRYLLEMDLVATVTAPMQPIDDPIFWQISDVRGLSTTGHRDHLWARILDPKAALEGRSYAAPGRIVLDVSDPLGYADALILVEIDADGTAVVSTLDGEAPDDAAAIAITVNELGALFLGGVSARTLVRAGRITELRPGSADAVDRSFRSLVAPWLSVWF